jgi:cyclopropane fatty-acyl-phospholipid synthase-like methyltransferase
MDFASRNLLPFLRPGDAVLDFGCGQSTTLARLLRREGYAAAAYDKLFFPDPEPLRVADRYDAVASVEVLEHLATPRDELGTLTRILRPGGFLAARTELRPGSADAFRDWWYRRDPTHIAFYHRETLDVICELFGFELVRCARGREIVMRLQA